jgi:general stress protein 26
METRTDAASREKVFDLIKDIKVALMVTMDRQGKLHARPMVAKQDRFEGDLWFFSSLASPKMGEIMAHPEIMLTYSDPSSQTYVAVLGKAQVVQERDRIRELWSEAVRTWFPKGPDDPDLALIRVDVQSAEYWDAPSSTFVYAYGYAKAVTTGQPPTPGDVKHVEFHEG